VVDCRDWFCEEEGWAPEEWRRLGSPETEVSRMAKNSDCNAFVDAEEDTCSDCQHAAVVAVHEEAWEFEGADDKDSSCEATASVNVATSSRLAAATAASFVAADEAAVVGRAASFESATDSVRTRAANAEIRCEVSSRMAASAEVTPGNDNSLETFESSR